MKRSVTRLFTVTLDVWTSTAFTCALLLVASAHTAAAAGVVGTGTAASCTEHALSAALSGGGVVTFNCGGPATITVTGTPTIQADTTVDGGGVITISGGYSVGICVVGHIGNLTVQNLTLVDGNGGNYSVGGALYNNGGTLTVTNCTFSGNGNAIYNTNGGTLSITNSTFSGNTPTSYGPGAIYNDSTLSITNSTFSGNSVGPISNSGTLSITNSTFSGNTGSGSIASGLVNYGTLTLTNTIVANSTKGANCSGTIIDGGHNIDDGKTCGFKGTNCTSTTGSSFCNTNPVLDPTGLANNGGPTQTIALCGGIGIPNASCTSSTASPAINAGNESICAASPVNNLDQRAYVRPGAGATSCSIGAYEYNAVPASPNPTPTPSTSTCVGDCNGDGTVTVDEILTMVNIALGNADATACPGSVPSGDEVNISLVLQAVNNALNGCGGG